MYLVIDTNINILKLYLIHIVFLLYKYIIIFIKKFNK